MTGAAAAPVTTQSSIGQLPIIFNQLFRCLSITSCEALALSSVTATMP